MMKRALMSQGRPRGFTLIEVMVALVVLSIGLLGIGKLVTFGGCGLWTLIDWFLIMAATDAYNRALLQNVGAIYLPGPQGPPPALPWR